MSFVLPSILWGMLLGAIPVIIHLLSRRRYRRMRWAATDFLLAALAERSRDVKIQDLVLLALRTLVLLLAVLAAARPVLSPAPARLAGLRAEPADTVLVLDDSMSMRTNLGAGTRMDMARRRAKEILSAFPEGSRSTLILTGGRPGLPGGLTGDRGKVAALIDASEATAQGSGALPALEEALGILKDSRAAIQRIILFTDGQARFFEKDAARIGGLLESAAPAVEFTVAVLPNEPSPDLAIRELRLKPARIRPGALLEIQASIEDMGEPPSPQTGVELWIDGRKVDRQKVQLTERKGTAAFRRPLAEPGLHGIEVRLDPDSLDLDSSRSAAIFIPTSAEIAVVEREEEGKKAEAARVYVEAALSARSDGPEDQHALPFLVRPAVDGSRLSREIDGSLWAVILADPGALPREGIEGLGRYVRGGGSVFISLGPRAAATLGNFRSGGKGAGSWLKGVDFSVADDGSKEAAAVRKLDLPEKAAGPSPFDLESPGLREALAAVDFFRTVSLKPPEQAGWSVPLRFGDSSPALLTWWGTGATDQDLGSGRLSLFASSLDPSFSDLPYRPAFVPFLEEVLLSLVNPRIFSMEILPGEDWAVRLPELEGKDGAEGLKVVSPEGEDLEALAFVEEISAEGGRLFRFRSTHRPGIYRLSGKSLAPILGARGAVTVNVDWAESSQEIWTAERIRSLFPPGRIRLAPAGGAFDPEALLGLSGREVWPYLAALLVAVLFLEALLAHRFSYEKKR